MERENKKRGRDQGEEVKDSSEKTEKKQELNHHYIINNATTEDSKHKDNKEGDELADDNCVSEGVFDFPWLKEGVVSKSEEDAYLEDAFLDTYTTTITSSAAEFSGQCLCESAATCMTSIDIPVDLFEENVWSLEGVDCTWNSQLNRPLQ